MANLLNLFWEEKLTGWDLDFSVGRRWVRLCGLERKAKFCQCWHAPEGRIDSLNNFLSCRLGISWGFWGETAARIAVLGMGLSRRRKHPLILRWWGETFLPFLPGFA